MQRNVLCLLPPKARFEKGKVKIITSNTTLSFSGGLCLDSIEIATTIYFESKETSTEKLRKRDWYACKESVFFKACSGLESVKANEWGMAPGPFPKKGKHQSVGNAMLFRYLGMSKEI